MIHTRFNFPDDYFVFDTETTGFNRAEDLVIEVGWCVVHNRQVVDNQGLLLDWTIDPRIDQDWLRFALQRTRESMAKKGRTYHFTYERLHEEGVPPWDALHTFTTLLYEYICRKEQLVGHNAWRFDREMMDGMTRRFMNGYLLPWTPEAILDTGLIEKAMQMNRLPYIQEDMSAWFSRIEAARIAGVTWALDVHCAPKYGLYDRFHMDQAQAHQAGFDCKLTWSLLETYRQMILALTT